MSITHTRRLALLAAFAFLLSACAGEVASSWPGITISGEMAFVSYGHQMRAIDIASGQQRWAYPPEPNNDVSFFAEPEVADGLLVAGGYNRAVYGLNPANGNAVWPAPFVESADHIVGQALVAGDTVYVPSADRYLYALDAATGAKRWSFKAQQAIWAAPVLVDGQLHVASLDHTIYALDPASGSVLWSRKLGGAIAGTPAVWDGLLIVGAFDNTLYAVRIADGSLAWSQATDGWVWSGPLADNGTLYFGDLAGYLYSADAETGARNWQVKPGGALRGTPALADDTLYAASRDGYVYFRSAADGTPVGPREVQLGGQLLSSPQVSGDLLIVGAYGAERNKIVFALDRATGATRWAFPPEG